MGTRNDFYIGRDPETMEWLGSQAWDGYPEGVFEDTGKEGYITPAFVVDDETWRAEVNHYLSSSGSNTWPEEGWPWPWNDSCTTDYAYTYDGGVIWMSCFGRPWVKLSDGFPEEYDEEKDEEINQDYWNGPKQAFPDMSEIKNVRRDKGSGIMLIGRNQHGNVTDLADAPVSNREGVEYPKAYPEGWEDGVEPNQGDVLQGVTRVLYDHQERKLDDEAAITKIRLLVS